MLLLEPTPIELSLCSKGRGVNHILSSKLTVEISEYSQLQDILDDAWVKFSGGYEEPQLCIWVDEGEQNPKL